MTLSTPAQRMPLLSTPEDTRFSSEDEVSQVTAKDLVESAEEWRATLRRADSSKLLLVVLGSSLLLAVVGDVVWMVVRCAVASQALHKC